MKQYIKIFLLLFALACTTYGIAQKGDGSRMQDVFISFISQKLAFNPAESTQMRPVIIQYLNASRRINRNTSDILLREQERANLKIQYRNQFTPIIGMKRASRFFMEEQIFRKKIRDELLQRRNGRQIN